ncbi:hypothetical protein ORJ04_16015 [Rheinheimera baltica]|uniref:DUF4397 domain-containing protein n=1 Tax=Rheinheimera baltica TaxID=67576 RepID=A0ABT9I279_9GAMM|nr:DUF4397 domain-containing protein [Rheinheimera baltica]MDP5137462.1 hypothetical protein [Rheinheimera baltica]
MTLCNFCSGQKLRLTFKLCLISFTTLILGACGSSDSENGTGLVKFYNASPTSPSVYLTLDEDLDSDEDDEFEQTFLSIGYGNALKNTEVPEGEYFYELGWKDGDSSERSELEIITESNLQIRNESITLVVLSNDIKTPEVKLFDIGIIDDESDVDNDLFNLRFLNVSPEYTQIDLYMSKSDETFNQAVLMGTLDYLSLTDNVKIKEDDYIFYITAAGGSDILFQSTEVSYQYNGQYIITVRPNDGVSSTPFVIDNIGNSFVATYQSVDAEARFRIYNGLQENQLMPAYTGAIDVNVVNGSTTTTADIQDLSLGQFSAAFVVDQGDYSLSVYNAEDDVNLVSSQLFSLPENTDRTVFFYMIEQDIDDDGDGEIEETEAKLVSKIVDNSTRERIYEHEVKMLNLAYNADITSVTFSFVKSDEVIETATLRRSTSIGEAQALVLVNNTYNVYAIGKVDGVDYILANQLLTLDETSGELFLLLETDVSSATGYRMRFVPQLAE